MDVSFGDFEFSFEAMKLRKRGVEVRLVGQPLHLLVMLLENPGKVVSREQIRSRLWRDTHVNFDHSLDAALNRLRTALGDNGKHPRFIETIPTVGYRFFAAVDVVSPAPAVAVPNAAGALRRVMWLVITAIVAALLALGIVRQRYDTFVPRAGQSAR
jgi:DNA-binding winged helix-turn-helix (wHTH) protein